jgi:amino-acid N-acetyltransferase
VESHLADFLAARHHGKVVGCIGMEPRRSDALFRSLAVTPAYRGIGLGRWLYEALEGLAKRKGINRAYLLTNSIEALAQAWGFKRIDRDKVPPAIQDTSEFQGGCCASAVPMWKDLRLP